MLASIIRGNSRAEDVGHLAMAAHLAMHEIGAMPWFEWLDSYSNPADGLSRAGLSDPWTLQQGWQLEEFVQEDICAVLAFAQRPAVRRILA